MDSQRDIIEENNRRNDIINTPFNPVTGEHSILERETLHIPDFPIPLQYVPLAMTKNPLVKAIRRHKTIRQYIVKCLKTDPDDETFNDVVSAITRIRFRHDFAFWAAVTVFIKRKGGGEDVRFVLNRPQRRLISEYEHLRMNNAPIRIILLKARQWGGSTATQLYFAWLQLVHKVGLNSLIVAHVKDTSSEIKGMFEKMLDRYPVELLHGISDSYADNEPKMVGFDQSGNTHVIPQRNCKIKIGTAEKPNTCRGGDYNLIHCSEVALWKKTEGKSPSEIVRSACSGVLYRPYTMIVYESTANGTGNFFQREYDAAKNGRSQFKAVFIAWFEIEQYTLPLDNEEEFAGWLFSNRFNENTLSEREEPGKYLWWLWEKGATLEAINWYITERAKHSDHADMAAEYPSDDVEAFAHSGERVFDRYKVEELRKGCRTPMYIGDIYADGDEGDEAFDNLRFAEDRQGLLWIWDLPDDDSDEVITDRYLTVVDVGGRSRKADYSVIVVFDRLYMMDGDKPVVAAQWYGHIDMDLLAWKAAQIAAFYDNSLLVIESNTLETHDRERQVDGDQAGYILNLIKESYPNLYERRQSEEEIREGMPKKYGFHTNIKTKPMVISSLVKCIRDRLYVERDERCVDEFLTYEKRPNGSFGAIIGRHDDLLMTRAIGLHICFHEMEQPQIIRRELHRKRTKAISEASV